MFHPQDLKRIRIWIIPLLFASLCLFFAWRWMIVKVGEMDRQQAYSLAKEAFLFMHKDAQLPPKPHNLVLTEGDDGQYLLEADGNKLTGEGPVESRFKVKLRHDGEQWSVVSTEWK